MISNAVWRFLICNEKTCDLVQFRLLKFSRLCLPVAYLYVMKLELCMKYFSGARSQMKIVDQQELRNDKYTVQDLKPETKYLFTFQSLSVGSAGGKNSTKFLEVTTDKGKLSKVVMGVISVCGFIGFVLIVIGLYATYR
jgi:hypothetical protein